MADSPRSFVRARWCILICLGGSTDAVNRFLHRAYGVFCIAALAVDVYLPALACFYQQRPAHHETTTLMVTFETSFGTCDCLDREAPERGWFAECKAHILTNPRVANMECSYFGYLTGGIKVAMLRGMATDFIISLVVVTTAEQVHIPFAGESGLQARLALILNAIANEKAFLSARKGKRFGELHGQRTQGSSAAYLTVTRQGDGEAGGILLDVAFVGLLNKVALFFKANLGEVLQRQTGRQEMVDQAVTAIAIQHQVAVEVWLFGAHSGVGRTRLTVAVRADLL